MDDVHSYVLSNNVHTIGIVKTWLSDGISDSEVSIPGVTMYRKDRSSVKSGKCGRVILYVHNSLSSSIIKKKYL